MAFEKITTEDTTGKGVTGLPAVPGLSVEAMQKKFDELSLDVIIPKFNALVEALMFLTGIESVSNVVNNSDKELVTGKAITDYALAVGAGDMLKSVYDADGDGKVDIAGDSDKLGGKAAAEYCLMELLVAALDGWSIRVTTQTAFDELPVEERKEKTIYLMKEE